MQPSSNHQGSHIIINATSHVFIVSLVFRVFVLVLFAEVKGIQVQTLLDSRISGKTFAFEVFSRYKRLLFSDFT